MDSVKSLFKKTRFWIAIAGVVAVVANHFWGFDETQIVTVIGAIVAGLFGASAGVAAGKENQ